MEINEGKYNIKALPTEGKTWREANEIEVAFTLDVGDAVNTFKGIISLSGIVKR